MRAPSTRPSSAFLEQHHLFSVLTGLEIGPATLPRSCLSPFDFLPLKESQDKDMIAFRDA